MMQSDSAARIPRVSAAATAWSSWALALLFLLAGPATLFGQGAGLGPSLGTEPISVQYPPTEYYMAVQVYQSGDLERAFDAFDVALSRTRKDVNGRWLDAIPVYAMMAECQYKLGDLEGAMQSLDTALDIAIRYRGWLRRPVWAEVLQAQVAFSPKQYLWPEANAVNRLPVTKQIKFYSGEQITEARLAAGGRMEELNIKMMDVVEIMRGLAIASYRRRIILGPLAENDPMAEQLLDSTKYPAELQVAIGRNLIGAMRVAERFGAKQDERAVSDAANTATFNGGVHPLSPIAGLCAASAMAGTENPRAAIPICLAIANQAASMDQFEWVGEALQLAAGCASEKEAPTIQQAGQVAATSLLRKSRLAALHCLIASADAAITAGDIATAQARLGDAKSLSMRRDVELPRLDAYGAYVAARIATRGGATAERGSAVPWDAAFSQMINFASNSRIRKRNLISMPRLFQLQRVRLSLGRGLDGLSGDAWLALYAADPTIDVWRRDPVDAIAGTMADRDLLRVARLRAAASRAAGLDVLTRMEDVRAGRVGSQLALGGRVVQVRSLSALPDELLTNKTVGFRNAAPKPIRDLRGAIQAAVNAPPAADPAIDDQRNRALESQAWSIALDRHEIPVVMPRPLDDKQPAAAIPDGAAILAFQQDLDVFHVVLSTNQKTAYWSVKGANRIGGEIAKVLRGIGAGPSRGGRLPDNDNWRDDAIRLRDRLIMEGTGPLLQGRLAEIEHLIVIPDATLWYLPFELIPTGERDSPLLGDALTVTYAASPALAMFPTALPDANPAIGFAAGKFFAPRDVDANTALIQSIVQSVPEGAMIGLPNNAAVATSRCGGLVGHLIVGEPTIPNPSAPLESPLASYEASLPGGQLQSWLGYPSAAPGSVFLAGFRSNFDTNKPTTGNEIFLTLSALQYSGVRDVIMSRWAVGGKSTASLVREYAQELPFLGPGKSFDRALRIVRRSELSPKDEPTMTGSDLDRETLTGDEPFFWSSYLFATPAN